MILQDSFQILPELQLFKKQCIIGQLQRYLNYHWQKESWLNYTWVQAPLSICPRTSAKKGKHTIDKDSFDLQAGCLLFHWQLKRETNAAYAQVLWLSPKSPTALHIASFLPSYAPQLRKNDI